MTGTISNSLSFTWEYEVYIGNDMVELVTLLSIKTDSECSHPQISCLSGIHFPELK